MTPRKSVTRRLVVPGVRDRILVGKHGVVRTRKVLCISLVPVPQSDTGGWDEYSKANGLRVFKELGKLIP